MSNQPVKLIVFVCPRCLHDTICAYDKRAVMCDNPHCNLLVLTKELEYMKPWPNVSKWVRDATPEEEQAVHEALAIDFHERMAKLHRERLPKNFRPKVNEG